MAVRRGDRDEVDAWNGRRPRHQAAVGGDRHAGRQAAGVVRQAVAVRIDRAGRNHDGLPHHRRHVAQRLEHRGVVHTDGCERRLRKEQGGQDQRA